MVRGAAGNREVAFALVAVVTFAALLRACDVDDVSPPARTPVTRTSGDDERLASSRPMRLRSAPDDIAGPAPVGTSTGSVVGTALRLDGAPAPGARIRAALAELDSGPKYVRASADGAFRFDALTPGRWNITCAGGGFGTRRDQGAEPSVADVVAGAETRVEIRGQALAQVTGRIVGPDGRPVGSATVRFQCTSFLSPGQVWVLDVRSDTEGVYAFDGVTPSDYVTFMFSAEGCGTAQRDVRDLAPGSRTVLDVTLERAAALDLVLVAADDRAPVRDAIVWIKDAESGMLYDGNRGDAFAPDEHGRIHATALQPRPVLLEIDANGFAAPETTLDPSSCTQPVIVELTRTPAESVEETAGGETARRITAHVVDPDGRPVPHFRVRTGETAGGDLCSSAGGNPRAGEISVEFRPGTTPFVEVWDACDAAGNCLDLGHVLLTLPTHAAETDVALPRERTIDGVVLTLDGKPVEGATIDVVTRPSGALRESMEQRLVGTTSVAGGAFRIRGLGDERVVLAATSDGFFGAPAEVAAGAKGIVLRIVPEVPCDLHVVDYESRPVRDAIVTVCPLRPVDPLDRELDPDHSPSTDAGGRVRLRGLRPARRYRLLVNVPFERHDLMHAERESWSPDEREIRLERAWTLEGIVRVGDAAPHASCEGWVEASDGRTVSRAEIGSDGHFRIEKLTAGRYRVQVVKGEPPVVGATVDAETGGAPLVLEVRWPAAR